MSPGLSAMLCAVKRVLSGRRGSDPAAPGGRVSSAVHVAMGLPLTQQVIVETPPQMSKYWTAMSYVPAGLSRVVVSVQAAGP